MFQINNPNQTNSCIPGTGEEVSCLGHISFQQHYINTYEIQPKSQAVFKGKRKVLPRSVQNALPTNWPCKLGFQLICRSLKVNETITYARMLWEGGEREEIIDSALHLPLWSGLFLSDSTHQSQGCVWNGFLRVCVCVCVYNHANENNSISPSGIH